MYAFMSAEIYSVFDQNFVATFVYTVIFGQVEIKSL